MITCLGVAEPISVHQVHSDTDEGGDDDDGRDQGCRNLGRAASMNSVGIYNGVETGVNLGPKRSGGRRLIFYAYPTMKLPKRSLTGRWRTTSEPRARGSSWRRTCDDGDDGDVRDGGCYSWSWRWCFRSRTCGPFWLLLKCRSQMKRPHTLCIVPC